MEQQMGLAARVDGIKFYFTADGSASNREGYMRSSIHCYNGISIRTGLIKTARSFDEADPYICVPAHSNAFAIHPDTRQEFLAWAMAATDAITILLPPGHSETGFNPYWSSFYPAKIKLNPGDEGEVALRIKNTSGHRISGRAWMKSHGDINMAQKEVNYDLGPREDGEIPVGIKIKSSCRPGTYILTADIEFGNELFGEYPQGYLVINE